MIRAVHRFIGVVIGIAMTSGAALATESVLSKADQDRVVCVSRRDVDGGIVAGQICKTGREWERTLSRRAAESDRSDRFSTSTQTQYLAKYYLYRTPPSTLLGVAPK